MNTLIQTRIGISHRFLKSGTAIILCLLGALSVFAQPAGNDKKQALIKTLEKTPQNVSVRDQLAEIYVAEKNNDKVIETLRPQFEKLDRRGLVMLAKAYEAKNDNLNQMRVLGMMISESEKDYEAQTWLGFAQLKNKQEKEAIKSFTSAIEGNKKYLPPYEGMAEAYTKLKNNYELKILYQDMVALFGEKPPYLAELCRLNVLDHYFEQAAQYCTKAIEKNPNFPDTHVYWSQYLKDSGEEKQSLKVLQKAASQFPKSELVQWTFADTMAQKKNYPTALSHYLLAAQADPKSARAQAGVANAAFETQKYEQSLEAYVKACMMDRKYMQDFRTSVARLRNTKEKEWLNKFEIGVEKCGL